ncbi:Serine/threonine-protein kinase PrkC [Gimesia alba]|uniref:non-specific serine/threonine protein kinase n=1 Tax=Gimesia alba TaxID=2527973 RepID=A0A517RFI9_9PLAN|nr:serine/threonine-protein kinase [Gimesia alba]QDT42620.1 Serine/threonine-protein kinase PrkC [Gimesia alba]
MAKQNKNTPEKKKRQSARVPKMESLGKYQIEKEIGAGGMGAVFLARDTTLNRLAALKILPRDKAENPVLVKRFKAEGQAAAHLRHENIVSVYDAGEEDGYLYIALEYVEGTDLHNLINKRDRIPVRRSLEIITQVTQALAHAYQQGIVHRDIKPANILIRQDGVVKLTDLGLARSIDDNTETSITRAGTTVGTVDYMAPEQARDSKAADIRSDIYSLGCTWYHMLTGRAPFSEGSLTNKLAAHATTPPPDPRELNDRVPEGIVAIIQRMMAKAQNARYQDPEELLEDLKNSNLKRSNVDNNVLEALASESDGEHAAIEPNTNLPADSSDFQINQFIPDFSSQTEDEEEQESSSRLSTSFDLQQLAGEVEVESEAAMPEWDRSKKTKERKSSRGSEPLSDDVEKPSRSRRPAPEMEEEGSVISDSAMKTRQSARARKPDTPAEQRKRPKKRSSSSKAAPQESASRSRPQRKSHKPTPAPPAESTGSDSQIAVDYRQIAMLAGAVILLILLIWWGINALSSSAPVPQGPGSNPFATAEQNQKSSQQAAPGEAPEEDETQAATEENDDSQSTVEVAKDEGDKAASDQSKQSNKTWHNMAVRGKEKKYLPEWGAGFSDLARGKADAIDPKLPVLKVATGATDPGVFGSLDEAVEAVTTSGAVIRLYGQGPFQLKPHRLQGVSQLIIMGDSEQSPVVLLQAGDLKASQPDTDLLSFSSGVLRLQGVHFLCDASQLPGTGVCNVFGIKQSDLTFQDCSFSLTGTGKRVVRLINSTGDPRTTALRPEGETRVLLENSVVTGNQLQTIRIDQLYADVLVSNCFISTKGAPCLELESLDTNTKYRAILQERKLPRTARIFSSTLLSDRSILELDGSTELKKLKPSDQSETVKPQTEIVVVNSVLIGNPSEKQSAAISLKDWPQDKLRKQSQSRFNDLELQVESSLFWGWPCYLRSTEPGNAKNVFQIDSHRTWQQSWGKILAAEAFNPDLPAEFSKLQAPAFVKPLLNFSKQKAVYAISEGGVIAGCDPAALQALSDGQLKRLNANLNKPQIEPAIQKVFAKAKTVSFDMTKGNLSEFLKSPAISGPTNVKVGGQGVCYTSPISLENKQVRLQFQQTAGTPLVVELRLLPSAAKKRPRDSKTAGISSFISLKNSTLEMQGGNFRISMERKGVVPKHFLVCQDSQLALDQCALRAVLINDRRFQSVVYVEPSTSGKSNQVLMTDSFLSASGTIIESRTPRLNLEVRNSLLMSQKDIFALNAQASASATLQISLSQSTLAPGETVFDFQQVPNGTKGGNAAARVFANESLFLPAPATSAARSDFSKTAHLFSIPQGIKDDQKIQWWGNSNGFMVERLHVQDGVGTQKSQAEFSSELRRLFGDEADQHALSIRGGIILQEQKLPPLVKIEPVHFQLLPTCKAASWSDLKEPLGADPAELQTMIQGGNQSPGKRSRINRAF